VKRGKFDAVDAEAICEAVRRPTMPFVEINTEEQQAILSIHRMRDLAARQRTQMANMIRRLLREFGQILPIGIAAVTTFPKCGLGGDHMQCYQFTGLNERIYGFAKMIEQHALLSTDARRLMHMPGIGPITALAIIATIGDAHQFRTGRDRAAWLGPEPSQQVQRRERTTGNDHKQG
jgi:transposase